MRRHRRLKRIAASKGTLLAALAGDGAGDGGAAHKTAATSLYSPALDGEVCLALLLHLGLFHGRMFDWLAADLAVVVARALRGATAKHATVEAGARKHSAPLASDGAPRELQKDLRRPWLLLPHDCADVQPLLMVEPVPLVLASVEALLEAAAGLFCAAPVDDDDDDNDNDNDEGDVGSHVAQDDSRKKRRRSVISQIYHQRERVAFSLALVRALRRFLGVLPLGASGAGGGADPELANCAQPVPPAGVDFGDGGGGLPAVVSGSGAADSAVREGLTVIFQLQAESGSVHAYKATVLKVSRKLSRQAAEEETAGAGAGGSLHRSATAVLPHYIRYDAVWPEGSLVTPNDEWVHLDLQRRLVADQYGHCVPFIPLNFGALRTSPFWRPRL
jgi:hypothetical protein